MKKFIAKKALNGMEKYRDVSVFDDDIIDDVTIIIY